MFLLVQFGMGRAESGGGRQERPAALSAFGRHVARVRRRARRRAVGGRRRALLGGPARAAKRRSTCDSGLLFRAAHGARSRSHVTNAVARDPARRSSPTPDTKRALAVSVGSSGRRHGELLDRQGSAASRTCRSFRVRAISDRAGGAPAAHRALHRRERRLVVRDASPCTAWRDRRRSSDCSRFAGRHRRAASSLALAHRTAFSAHVRCEGASDCRDRIEIEAHDQRRRGRRKQRRPPVERPRTAR